MVESRRGPLGPAAKEFSLCAVAECNRTILARGLCCRHYHASYRDQTLPPRQDRRPPKVSVKTTVTPEMEALLMQQARRSGRTVSDIIRAAVEAFLKTIPPN